MAVATGTIDPVRYEVFAHRLWAIGEEGRVVLQRVSASPIVVQGGECMQSFYDPQGRMVLACSGHLRFAAATSDAIKQLIAWFGRRPGFFDGDQVFFNDPYVAGSLTYDQMVVKPIFFEGRLVAWTASSSHTADTGGVLAGEASEVYHEGIRILGLKVVERGEFRDDVCRTLVEQCRDPHYVELDLRSRVAANNVAAGGFTTLLRWFGPAFVMAACQKLIDDGEALARARLRQIPDGTWTSRVYGSTTRGTEPYRILCRATKRADRLILDCAGTSPQSADDMNSTLPSSRAHIALALTNTIFWDVPWSDGKMAPVDIRIPEGTILNCHFPAACTRAPNVGKMLVLAVMDCTARMLYAAGLHEDVNAGWHGLLYNGGPGYMYGGHNAEGIPVAMGLFDVHGGGFGATPGRDGVDSAGHPNIPSGGINDVERVELHYPLLYFSRSHLANGAGYGAYRGGAGTQRIYMTYRSDDLSVEFRRYVGAPQTGPGLFGGYPMGGGGLRALFQVDLDRLCERLQRGEYPATVPELLDGGWGSAYQPQPPRGRIHLPSCWLVTDFVQSGGGFGDPLERDPERVAADVRAAIYTPHVARRGFGVVLDDALGVQIDETSALREALRRERLAAARPVRNQTWEPAPGAEAWPTLLRPHASVEIAGRGGAAIWRCVRCQHAFGPADQTYKLGAALRVVDLNEVVDVPFPGASGFLATYLEYFCPGCATLLQVDLYYPGFGDDMVLPDIEIEAASYQRSAISRH
ncbi:MAG: hydantoinase B/oxoprolinase family protein [Chloroflexi bacterium]|nr:hydantoinase B/oxoprolinase family protein [Chloroflexota bacterium]